MDTCKAKSKEISSFVDGINENKIHELFRETFSKEYKKALESTATQLNCTDNPNIFAVPIHFQGKFHILGGVIGTEQLVLFGLEDISNTFGHKIGEFFTFCIDNYASITQFSYNDFFVP